MPDRVWGSVIAGALAGLVVGGCSSEPALPVFFTGADCGRELVMLGRFDVVPIGAASSLAVHDGRLYLAYSVPSKGGDAVPPHGGVLSLPTTADAITAAAVAPADAASWDAGAFWVDADGAIVVQDGDAVSRVPAGSQGAALPAALARGGPPTVYAHDDAFAYAATVSGDRVVVAKTPSAGGAPITLLAEAHAGAAIGAMDDFGDALLLWVGLPMRAGYSTVSVGHLWRVPKDGSARSDVRPDIGWAAPSQVASGTVLAWDGAAMIGPALVAGRSVLSRTPPDSGPLQPLRISGSTFARRGDEIIVAGAVSSVPPRVLVASSKGDTQALLACGTGTVGALYMAGVAADDSGVYVAWYESGSYALFLARVPE